jgi:hypothetical protein
MAAMENAFAEAWAGRLDAAHHQDIAREWWNLGWLARGLAAQQVAEADRAGRQDALRLALAYLSAHGPAGIEDMPAHVAAVLACEAALGPAA